MLFLILAIAISGCKAKSDTKKSIEEIRTGTEGIVLSFLANTLPSTIHVEEGVDNSFDVVLELRNKGAYPQPEDKITGPEGKLYLSGYDANIISFQLKGYEQQGPLLPGTAFNNPIGYLAKMALDGKSTINPNGGQDIISFTGTIDPTKMKTEKYDLTLLATACYNYNTIAGPSVCIDPDPYSTTTEKKVCEVKDITLQSQGAPVAVTRIDEEAFAQRTQFRITIKNVGGGDTIKVSAVDKCDPFGSEKLEREDIDKVYILGVTVGDKHLECKPLIDTETGTDKDQGYVRLINGEGSVICELSKNDYGKSNTAYTTPLNIKLVYVYRNTAERKIQIKKEQYS